MKNLIIFLVSIVLLSYSFVCSSSDASENKVEDINVVEDTVKEVVEEWEEIRLLESITYNNGYAKKFYYDSLCRIIKIQDNDETTILVYDDSNNIVIDSSFIGYSNDGYIPEGKTFNGSKLTKEGNIITKGLKEGVWDVELEETVEVEIDKNYYKYYLDTNGNLIKWSVGESVSVYKYDENDNEIENNDSLFGSKKYEYDDKKSPFIHCNTPKWWIQSNVSRGIKNNRIKRISKYGVTEYVYEYDNEGYPIKCIQKPEEGSLLDKITYKYIHLSRKK